LRANGTVIYHSRNNRRPRAKIRREMRNNKTNVEETKRNREGIRIDESMKNADLKHNFEVYILFFYKFYSIYLVIYIYYTYINIFSKREE